MTSPINISATEINFFYKNSELPILAELIEIIKKIRNFKPDLIAVSCTETTFLRGMQIIDDSRDLGIKNIFDYKDSNRFEGTDLLNSYDPGRRFYFEIKTNFRKGDK